MYNWNKVDLTRMQKRLPGVYCVMCRNTKNMYIGSSHRPRVRYSSHISQLEKGEKGLLWQQDYLNYGKESFDLYIIEFVNDLNIIRQREEYWINLYWSSGKLYNQLISACGFGFGEDNPMFGKKLSKKSKLDLSIGSSGKEGKNKGLVMPENLKVQIRNTLKNKWITDPEYRDTLLRSRTKLFSDESYRKKVCESSSKTMTSLWKSSEFRDKKKQGLERV